MLSAAAAGDDDDDDDDGYWKQLSIALAIDNSNLLTKEVCSSQAALRHALIFHVRLSDELVNFVEEVRWPDVSLLFVLFNMQLVGT